MADWIDSFMAATAHVPSPEQFRLWAGITAVSGVLERKVWTIGSAGPIYPHLFTVLVGAPGSGKDNAIRPVREIWAKIQGLNLSPDNVTKAALIDALSRATRTIINGASEAYIFSSMCVPCPEFGVFFTHHDLEFLSVLNHIFTSPNVYREERRTAGIVEVNKPHLVLLGGTQPDFLNSLLPEEAWGMGFTSRLILIYGSERPTVDLFAQHDFNSTQLAIQLNKIFGLKGEFVWTENARREINAWNEAKCPPQPTHNKLLNYNTRRALHVIKLSMVASASRSLELMVTVEDFERAKSWLIDAERTMPDIFRAMGQKSDQQILEDLHFHLYRKWSSVVLSERKPLGDKDIYQFLQTRVPSERISRMVDVAEKAGFIRKGPFPGEWIPNPLGTQTSV